MTCCDLKLVSVNWGIQLGRRLGRQHTSTKVNVAHDVEDLVVIKVYPDISTCLDLTSHLVSW